MVYIANRKKKTAVQGKSRGEVLVLLLLKVVFDTAHLDGTSRGAAYEVLQ